MPVYTRIIISAPEFLDCSKELLNKYGIHCYVEYRDSRKKALYKKIDLSKSFDDVFTRQYSCFFLVEKELKNLVAIDFYSDELFPYTVEANGGRENETEIEQLDLRIVGKEPAKNIRLFINALNSQLTKDPGFGKGVKVKDYLNKAIFYKKGIKKKIWGSFERKSFLEPIELPAE